MLSRGLDPGSQSRKFSVECGATQLPCWLRPSPIVGSPDLVFTIEFVFLSPTLQHPLLSVEAKLSDITWAGSTCGKEAGCAPLLVEKIINILPHTWIVEFLAVHYIVLWRNCFCSKRLKYSQYFRNFIMMTICSNSGSYLSWRLKIQRGVVLSCLIIVSR